MNFAAARQMITGADKCCRVAWVEREGRAEQRLRFVVATVHRLEPAEFRGNFVLRQRSNNHRGVGKWLRDRQRARTQVAHVHAQNLPQILHTQTERLLECWNPGGSRPADCQVAAYLRGEVDILAAQHQVVHQQP